MESLEKHLYYERYVSVGANDCSFNQFDHIYHNISDIDTFPLLSSTP